MPRMSPLSRRAAALRREATMRAVALAYENLAAVTADLPLAHPRLHGFERARDLAYGPEPAHTLDVFRPRGPGPHPVVFYVHGGAFRSLSKDTHWIMGLALARRGYVAVLPNYRMAPEHHFPTPLEDTARAYLWTTEHVAAHGGDPARIAIAGESAGGNLAAALGVAASFRRHERWARRLYEDGAPPMAVLPLCAVLEVSDPGRFARRKRLPVWLEDQIHGTAEAYLGPDPAPDLDLANPLWLLERGVSADRALPPFFAAVGTRDPLLDDTRRLARALDARGIRCTTKYYPGEVHAFHALVWRRAARQCWRDVDGFLREVMAARRAPAAHALGV